MRVALLQLTTPATQAAALAQVAPLVREAAAGGAQLILTPEGTNLLERDRPRLFERLATEGEDACVQGLRALAAELGVHLLVGSALLRREDGQAANRSLLIDPAGAIAARYDKVHMFDVDLPTGERHRESAAYTRGERLTTVEAAGATLGLSICYDLRFPHLYRRLAQAGAQVLTVPSAFTRPTGAAHWEVLLRARAIETGAFVLAPAQGGVHEDGRATYGHSLAVGPWGEVLAAAEGDGPCIVAADLDLEAVTRARAAIPAWRAERAFTGP